MANKIVALMLAKNDADIIESSIRHATKFVDTVFIHDQNSVDDTQQILLSLQNEKLPIRIFETDIDSMIQTAVDENATVILPMHADEFLIAADGKNSADLRRFLQGLSPDKIYSLSKNRCRFLDSEDDQDLYALNRPVLRENLKESALTYIIGSEVWKKDSLKFSDLQRFQRKTFVYGLTSLHFPIRSKIQKKFREMLAQIEHVEKNTIYDPTPKNSSTNLESPSSADSDLMTYRNECRIIYTKPIDPLQNLFKLSQNLARQQKINSLLDLKKSVRVFIFHHGSADKTIESIESVKNQTYPHKKIFVVNLKTDESEKIFEVEKKSLSEFKFIDSASFSKILKENAGDYVQFVTPGDKLRSERLSHMVELMNSSHNFGMFFSESTKPIKSFVANYMSMVYPKNPELQFEIAPFSGLFLFTKLLETGYAIPAGISRAFFKQNFFDGAVWIDAWLSGQNVESYQYVLWNAILNMQIGFVNEVLIDSGAEDWTQKNLVQYLNIWKQQIQHFRGSKYLPEEKYLAATKNFNEVLAKSNG